MYICHIFSPDCFTECGLGCLSTASLLQPLTSGSDDDDDSCEQADLNVYSQYTLRLVSHGLMDDKVKISTILPLKAYMIRQQTEIHLSVINRWIEHLVSSLLHSYWNKTLNKHDKLSMLSIPSWLLYKTRCWLGRNAAQVSRGTVLCSLQNEAI